MDGAKRGEHFCLPRVRRAVQLVDELLSIWSLDDYENTLEELEEALIVGVGHWLGMFGSARVLIMPNSVPKLVSSATKRRRLILVPRLR